MSYSYNCSVAYLGWVIAFTGTCSWEEIILLLHQSIGQKRFFGDKSTGHGILQEAQPLWTEWLWSDKLIFLESKKWSKVVMEDYQVCNNSGCMIQSINRFDGGFYPVQYTLPKIIREGFKLKLFLLRIISNFYNIIVSLFYLTYYIVFMAWTFCISSINTKH